MPGTHEASPQQAAGYQKPRTTPAATLAYEAFVIFSLHDTGVPTRYAAFGHIRSHSHANIIPKAEASFGELTPKRLKVMLVFQRPC